MWTPRLRFGRRRRKPASAALVLVFCLGYVGYDQLLQSLQEREAWSGTVVKVYREKGFLATHRSPAKGYWDVRTTDGHVRTVRIWTRSIWDHASPGDSLIKREGELHPQVLHRP